jgi:LCP family protein required for cell wall assembly
MIAGVAVVILGFGTFTYFRVTSFVDDSFSGRNEASLLTVTPKVKATATAVPTIAPTPTSAPQNVTEAPLVLPTLPPIPTATPVPPTPTPANLPAIIQKIKQGEQISVLVTGYGGGQHDGAYLTDTILVMTYDPDKNAVTMVNVPRDLYVFIPYGGPKIGFWGKINSAFGYVMNLQNSNGLSSRYRFNANDPKTKVDGAINLLKDVVEQVTGIPIDYWATFSFDGFRKFIDAIGGVDVNVETTFDDYEYPANDDPNIDASVMHIHFDAGLQHMNGEKAIEYARSRHSVQDGSDFGRSKRQMKLVQATKEKVAKPDIMLKAFGLMDALQGNLRTSLSLDEARALMDYFQGEGAAAAKNILFVSQVLSTDNFLASGSTSDGAYILWPYAGQSNYKAIQEWLARGRDFPELRAESLKVQVQNGSGQQALMTRINSELEQNGIDTLNPAWANTASSTVIMDYSGGKSSSTLKAIMDVLPGVTVQTLKKPYPQAPDVVVLLGRDLTQTANNKPNVLNLPAGQPEVSPTPLPVVRQE